MHSSDQGVGYGVLLVIGPVFLRSVRGMAAICISSKDWHVRKCLVGRLHSQHRIDVGVLINGMSDTPNPDHANPSG